MPEIARAGFQIGTSWAERTSCHRPLGGCEAAESERGLRERRPEGPGGDGPTAPPRLSTVTNVELGEKMAPGRKRRTTWIIPGSAMWTTCGGRTRSEAVP